MLQHTWAELSEKFADIFDPAIKYGKGDEFVRLVLETSSGLIARIENLRRRIVEERGSDDAESRADLISDLEGVERDAQRQLQEVIQKISEEAGS